MRVELVSVTHAMLHEVMHANKAIFGLWASSLFRCNSIEQLSAASPLQPSFVCPCVVSLCSAVWFYVAKNDYMAAIYQPLCHCYATVISLCCLSTELTLTLIFSYKNLPFQTLVRWRLLYYQQLFPWLFDTLRKSSIKYLHYFYTTI